MKIILLSIFICFLATTHQLTAQAHYYQSTARSTSSISTTFPYDINLLRPDSTSINTAELFKNNEKPVVLLFWLTTCFPCRMELDAIKSKYEGWTKEADFRMVAISTDYPHNFGKFAKRVAENNWGFEAYNDVNKEFSLVMPGGLNGLPQVFILNTQGEIVYHKRKYQSGDEDILFEKIKELQIKK